MAEDSLKLIFTITRQKGCGGPCSVQTVVCGQLSFDHFTTLSKENPFGALKRDQAERNDLENH